MNLAAGASVPFKIFSSDSICVLTPKIVFLTGILGVPLMHAISSKIEERALSVSNGPAICPVFAADLASDS